MLNFYINYCAIYIYRWMKHSAQRDYRVLKDKLNSKTVYELDCRREKR